MKKVVGIFIILLLLVCINFVSADENITLDNQVIVDDTLNNTNISDNSSYNHTEVSSLLSNSPVLGAVRTASGGSFSDFQGIINSASSGDTIELSGNYTYNGGTDSSLVGGISVSKTLTINGNGYSFSGVTVARIFNINAANVLVRNVFFTQGNTPTVLGGSYRGGAIFNTGSNVRIYNCTFFDNYGYIGCAIEQRSGSMYVEDCYFLNNTLTNNGGHTVCADGVIYITHCIFEGNNGGYSTICIVGGGGYAKYNAFLTLSGSKPVVVGGGGTANDNWWGTNSPDIGTLVEVRSGSSLPTSWIVMNFTNMGNVSSSGGGIEFLSTLNTVYSSASTSYYSLDSTMFPRTVEYTSTGGVFNSSSNIINWNDTVSLSYPSGLSGLVVNATIDGQVLSIGSTDLVLNLSMDSVAQITGSLVYSLVLSNHGSFSARDVLVYFKPPSDLVYVGASSTNYNNITGVWSVGTLNAGSSIGLNVTVKVPYDESYIGCVYNSSASISGTFLDFNLVNNNPSVEFTIGNISKGSYTLLQSLIDSTPSGGSLDLLFDIEYDPVNDVSLKSGMVINKPLSINGNGYTINGLNQSRIFCISGSNVNLTNISFTGGYTVNVMGGNYRGGAIYSDCNNLRVTNCTFFNNSGSIGSAIEQRYNTIYINDCIFRDNYVGAHVICIDGTGYVTDCVFVNNQGDTQVVCYIGTGYMTNSVMFNNTGSYMRRTGSNSFDNNWWGTNTPNFASLVEGAAPTSWLIMNFTNLNNVSTSGGYLELLSTLNTVYSSTTGLYSSYTSNLPARTVEYSSTSGVFNSSSNNIIGNDTVSLSYPSGLSDLVVNASIDGQVLSIGSTDLVLNLTMNSVAQITGTLVYSLVLSNPGSFTARDVIVYFKPPTDLTYVSCSNSSYNITTGVWSVGTLNNGSSICLNVTVKVPYDESYIGRVYNSSASISGTFLDFNLVNNNPSVEFTIGNITQGSYTVLQSLMDETPTGGTLNLSFDIIYDPINDAWLQTGMRVNKSININGNGHTINGLNQSRIFLISGSNINLTNIFFTGGYAINQVGDNNYRGGAIFNSGNNINITNCTFFNNTGEIGPAIEQWRNCVMYVDNCYFLNNTVTTRGGHTVCADGPLYITHCVFEGNIGNTAEVLLIGAGGYAKYNSFLSLYNNTPVGVGGGATIDDNWWGTNTPNINSLVQLRTGSSYPTRWFVMNFTNLEEVSTSGGSVELLTSLNTIYDSSTRTYTISDSLMAPRTVKYETSTGNFNSTNNTITWNDTVKLYYPSSLSNLNINATIDNQVLSIGTSNIELNITVTNNQPQLIETITYTITAYNKGTFDARDVNIYFTPPSSFTYLSDTNNSNYNWTTGVWNIGTITNGTTHTLNITVRIPFDYTLVNKEYNSTAKIKGTYFTFNEETNKTVNITVKNRTGGSYTVLQYFIDNTPTDGELNLTFNVTYDNITDVWLKNGMRLNKTITIYGNGYTIDGLNQSRIFYVTGANVKISNMTITRGNTVSYENGWRGGGIYSVGQNFNVSNCTFTYNYGSGPGFAIQQWSNTIYIEDTIFKYNYGDDSHVICIDSTGYVNRCLFEENTASLGQTICYIGTGYINNSVMVNNTGSYMRRTSSNSFDNNWWGTNNPNFSYLVVGDAPITWIIMNFTNTTPITTTNGVSNLTVSLNTTYNRNTNTYIEFNSTLPYRNLTYTYTVGNVNPDNSLIQGISNSNFTYPNNMGAWIVNATIDNQTLFIGSTDLEILISSNKNPVDDGDNISFTITVINHGYVNATNVNISLEIPIGLDNLSFLTNNGTFNTSTMTWQLGNINASSNKTLIINATLNNPGHNILLNASINPINEYEANTLNNNYTYNLTVIQWNDLLITKTIQNQSIIKAKENITYIITVYNQGPSTARNITVYENLSTKIIYQNSNTTNGYYNQTSGIWFIDNITPGANETLNLTVFINESGFINNFVNVSSLNNDTNQTNNIANISFTTPPLSDLWVNITIESQTSNYITYHIQAGNNGIEPANGTVVVLNHSNYYFYYNHTLDKGDYNNLTGVWDIGYLNVNETVNLTLIVRLDFPLGVNITNITTSANITSWSTDLYLDNNTDTITFEAELFGNFRLLQWYIDQQAPNTIFILPRSFAYDEIQDAIQTGETYNLINGVSLYKNITIINPYGFTISGFNKARIFNISSNNIILNGLRLVDGYSPLGAALNIHADNIQILNSNFTNNWLYGDYGGAIYTNGKNNLIMDCKFIENTASKLGGAIGATGAINLQILNNTFINNIVESDIIFGGAIGLINTSSTINYNVFLDNQAIGSSNLGNTIYVNNSNVNLEANWFGNNTPNMISDELIYGIKPETYIILDWQIVNPNMNSVTLNTVFLLYNTTSGNKTPLDKGIPYRTINISSRNPTLSVYNTTYTGNTSVNYTYDTTIPVYQVNATVDHQTITLEWSTFLDTYKTLINNTIWFGDDLIYIINLTNYGPHNSYVVNIADLLPENLTINNINPTSGSTSIINDNVYWSIVVTAGTNETLIINTTPITEGFYLNNLTVNSTNPYDYFLHSNNTVLAEVLPLIDLSINITISNPPYIVGEDLNYTITIHNNGPSNSTNVKVSIPIPTGLSFKYIWNLDGYTPDYNPSTGIWNVGNLSVNQTIQVNITLSLDNPNTYIQTVNITGYGLELNNHDNNQTISFNVTSQVDLELNMTINTNETLYGNIISITYSLLNKGPSPSTNTNVYTIFNDLTYYTYSGYGNFNNITPFTGYWNIGTLNKGNLVTITIYFYTTNIGNFTVTGRANSSNNESNWLDNYDNISVSVIKYADLSITKTVNDSNPFLEQTITYTINVTNNAGFDATNVIVEDILPSVLVYNNSNPSFNGTHWIVGNLSVGETKTLSYNVTIDGIGTIWNNATVNSSLNDSNPNNNHAEVSIDVPIADDLRIYINVIPSTPSSNNDFLINISIWNRGFTDNQNVTVEFHIPSGLIYINSTQMGAYNLTSGLWDIGFLANGAWTNLELWVRPDTIGNITLEANVSGFVADTAPWNNRANLTFEIMSAFDLTITKTTNTTLINDGDLIGFDISVWNNGPYTATNVQVTDYIPYGLLYYSNNASGVYDTNLHTVNWTIPTLNMGDNLTFHLTLRSWNPGSSFTNLVTVGAYGTDSNITDNTASVTVNVTQINDLEVRINASKTTDIDLGEIIVFYITVLNHGPSNATNVITNFEIPNIFTYLNDNSGGYYLPSTGNWFIGNLESNTNTTLAIIVNLTTIGLTKANVTVNSTYLDKNLSNNYDELNISATPVFDLNITGYWNLTNNTLVWGELANLTIIVHNKGPENATNVTVEISIPGVSYINDTSSGSFNNTTMTWNIGNLSAGETKTLTITFKGDDCGFYWTIGNITAHGHENNTSDNNYTLNLTIIPVVDLVMTNLTVNALFAGVDEILEFNMTVYNKGPCNATNTTIVGLLPTSWTIYSGSVVADIPVNTSHTFNIYVNASTYGNFTIGFNATINGIDTYPLDNHKFIGPIEIIYHTDIRISIKVSNEHPATGDIIVYVITVSNLDWRTAHNLTANITIPSNLSLDHYYLASGVYNPLNGTWTIGDLSFRNSTSLFLFARVNTPEHTSFWVNVTGDDYDFHPENNNDTIDIIASSGLDLNITITADNSTPYTGSNVTFTVSVENIGSVDATDVSVDIKIPTGFINPHSNDLNFTGNSWFVGNLSIGSTKTLNFTLIPLITNNLTINVKVSANKYDYNSSNNNASVSVSSQGASDLEVTITSNNSNPMVGENVTYTITVKNNGLINVDNVFVFNNLPYSLTYSTSILSYNPITKIWSISNLPPSSTETLNITINHTNTGIVNYTVNITGATIDTNTSNNQDNITTNVIQDNDLKTEFTVSNRTVLDNDLLEFNITVINTGIFNDTDVKVYTNLPTTGIYNSTGIFDTNKGIWNIGNLSSGENKTLALIINMTGVGNYIYWANVTGTQNDHNLTNNNQNLNISVYSDFDLIVNITTLNTTININDTITFQITASNNGPSTAYDIKILDNIYGTVQGISKGTYTNNTWNISNLKAGESQTLNLTIKPTTNGTYTYTVNISTDNIISDHNITNNNDNITINVTNLVDLIITINSNTSIVDSGNSVEYTINIYNNGSITATNVLMEELNLFDNIISISPSTGLVSSNSWLIFTLAPNTTETLKLVRYVYKDTVSFVNVTSNNPDSNNSTNTANNTVNIIKKTDLQINITSNTTELFAGDNVTFTITVTNLGNNTANNVTVKLDLPYTINYDNIYMYDSLQGIWLIGNLENNTSISFNITSTINTEGLITFNTSVNSTTPDINLINNYDNITLNISSLIDLNINLKLNTTSVLYSGDNFTIFVNLTNYGPSNATNINVTINIPGTYTTFNGTYTSGIWNIGNLNIDETVYLNITSNLTSANNGIYTINVTSSETDKDLTNNNASINLTIIDISDLGVNITSSVNQTDILNTVIYTVTVTNYGPNNVNDAIVELNIPTGFNITNNMSSSGVFNGTHWKLNTLSTGFSGIANLYIFGYYTTYGNQTISVNVNSSNKDYNSSNNLNNVSVWITPVTNLTVNFTTTAYYNIDGTITFNITITNNGPCNATNIKIYTNLEPTDSYNETSGYFDTLQDIWYINKLLVGQTETLIINTIYISGMEVYANATSNTKELDNSDNIKTLNFTLTPLADLNINIISNNSNPLYGESVEFTITVTNLGVYNATNVIVYTSLPSTPSYTVSKGLFSTVSGNWSIGNLTSGETVILKITLNLTNDLIAHVNVTGNVNDTNNSNNNDTINISLKQVVNLNINLTVNQSSFTVGDNITFTINVTNYGPNTAENLTINITLPDGFIPDTNYNWTLSNLTNDSSVTYNITGILSTPGIKYINTTVTSDTYNNDTNNNLDSLVFDVEDTVDLIITVSSNTSSILAGEYVNLLVNVTNIGNGTAHNVLVQTNIINGTGDKTGYYDKDTGYWYIENLTSNNTVLLNITIQLTQNTTYNVNVNTTSKDINLLNNNDTISINVTPQVDLDITIITNSKTLYYGDEVIYTIYVTNYGPSLAKNVLVNLTNNTLNLTYVNTNSFDNITNLWNIENLSSSETVILILKYLANDTGNITSFFNITTNTIETNLNNNQVNVTVEILNSTKPLTNLVDLIINITPDNPNPSINSTVTFNITVYNNMSTTANNLTILSFIPSDLTPLGVYDWNITTIPPYSNISFTFQANISNYGSYVVNTSVNSNEWDINPTNNRANTLITCNAPSEDYTDLTVNITRTGNLTINELITYLINVTNNGPNLANNVNITIGFANGLEYLNDNGTGSYNYTNSLWTIGNLNPSETKTLEIKLNITQPGYYTNVFLVYSDEMDNQPKNNLVLDKFEINDTRTGISLRINANKTYTTSNETIQFTVTVTNPYPNTAHNINISLNIPPEFIILNNTNKSYSLENLSSGTSYNFTFTAQLNTTNSSTITVNATLNETDIYYEDNTDNITITSYKNENGVANLSINITVNEQYPEVGTVPIFNIWVTNHGPDDATNITIPVFVPENCVSTSVLTPTGSSWDNSTSTFHINNLTINTTMMLEVSFRINNPNPILFNVTTYSNEFDPNITDNTATISLYPWEATPTCDLNITIVPVGNEFYANGTVTLNITIRNLGTKTAYNISIRNIVPEGLTIESIKTTWAYTNTSYGWFMNNHPINTNKSFLVTYKISNPGLYQTTVNVNSSTFDVNPTNNGIGVAIYAGDAEPDRRNVTTKTTPTIAVATLSLSSDTTWNFKGTLKMANTTTSPTQAFQGQKLYANITKGTFSLTVESIDLTSSTGVANFQVAASQLDGTGNYKVLIYYAGEKTDDTYYLPSVATAQTKRVTINS